MKHKIAKQTPAEKHRLAHEWVMARPEQRQKATARATAWKRRNRSPFRGLEVKT